MTDDDDRRSQAATDILDALGELRQAMARMEALLRQIAVSLGIDP